MSLRGGLDKVGSNSPGSSNANAGIFDASVLLALQSTPRALQLQGLLVEKEIPVNKVKGEIAMTFAAGDSPAPEIPAWKPGQFCSIKSIL
jgi:hypothetical protein